MRSKRGFTLIELMVAIAIVAVLATVGFTLFQGVQAQARDTKRKGDIDAISRAYENKFNASTGLYAPLVPGDFSAGIVPLDPINSGDLKYSYTGSYTVPAAEIASYILCAKLEKRGGNASNMSGAYAAGGDFYCLKNQQQ